MALWLLGKPMENVLHECLTKLGIDKLDGPFRAGDEWSYLEWVLYNQRSLMRFIMLLVENKNYVYRCDCVEFACFYDDQKNVA